MTTGCSRVCGSTRDAGQAHVTAVGCDDGVAVSLCAGSLNALALHGFQPGPPDMSEDQVVLVGGGNIILQDYLLEGLRKAGFDARNTPACGRGELNGPSPSATSSTAPCSASAARSWKRFGPILHDADVRRAQPLAAQAHHHPAVLDLRGGMPRRARPARSRADRCQAWASMSAKLTLLKLMSHAGYDAPREDGLTWQNASP